MNKEDIIRMAREAGFEQAGHTSHQVFTAILERFATLAYNEGRRHALYEARNALNDKFGL